MIKKSTYKNTAYLINATTLIARAFVVYFIRLFAEKATTTISLQPDKAITVDLDNDDNFKNCASYQCLAL